MAIIVFQHWNAGGPGRLGATLRDHGFALSIRRLDQPTTEANRGVPSDLDDVHGVVILGGPQNVTDIANYPWMQAQAAFIKKAHDAQLPVIGICLGAQLIAHALGGQVAPRANPMAGFYDTKLTVPGQTETMMAGVPWNSKMFYACEQEVTQTPPGAVVLAGGPEMKNQVFKVGMRTYAFAYHFECDKDGVVATAEGSKGAGGGGEVKAQLEAHYANMARIADRLCVNLATYLFPVLTRLA